MSKSGKFGECNSQDWWVHERKVFACSVLASWATSALTQKTIRYQDDMRSSDMIQTDQHNHDPNQCEHVSDSKTW